MDNTVVCKVQSLVRTCGDLKMDQEMDQELQDKKQPESTLTFLSLFAVYLVSTSQCKHPAANSNRRLPHWATRGRPEAS